MAHDRHRDRPQGCACRQERPHGRRNRGKLNQRSEDAHRRGTREQERARKQQPCRVPRWLNQVAAVKEARRTEHERRGPHGRSRQTNRPAGSNCTRRRAEKGLNPCHGERRGHGERKQAQDRARPRHRQRRDCSAGTSAGRVNTPLVGTQPSAMSQ